eukprot:761097-Pleurochrysis_carterae.AAC.1
MEGVKGGGSSERFYTGKRSISARWNDFKSTRYALALPLVGSESLFKKIWCSHTEIRQYSA